MAVEVLKSRFANSEALRQRNGGSPLALVIDGTAHEVSRLAEDGAVIVDYDREAEPGQMLSSVLAVALDGFDLTVPALWEVIANVRDRRQLWLRLAPVNEASHQATITTVLEAIRSGEVLRTQDILGMARADEAAYEAEAAPEPAHGGIKRRLSAILFVLLAIVLVGFIVANLAARAFFVHADGAIVSPQLVVVQAPEEAELMSVAVLPGARVAPGALLASLRTVSGQVLKVTSPCDCIVSGQVASAPLLLRRGQPVVKLIPAAGVDNAVLTIALADLRRVQVGDRATVRYYDSPEHLGATIVRVNPPRMYSGVDAQPSRFAGTVELKFDHKIPPARVGEAVTASVRLSHLNPFA